MPRFGPRRIALAAALVLALGAASPLRAEAPALPDSERALIEALIDWVGELRGTEFVRNGKPYEARDAARFLRKKWASREDEVHSADDFIDRVATRSSTSGQPYAIRHPDGRELPSAEFLKARLGELRQQAAARGDGAQPSAAETFLQPNATDARGEPLYLHFSESDMPLRIAIAKPAIPAKYGSRARTREVAIEAMRLWETAIQPHAPWFRLKFVEQDPSAPVQVVWKRRLVGAYAGFGGIEWELVDGRLRVTGEMTLSTMPDNRTTLGIDAIRLVVAHEFGHVLGLMHCHACDSAMNYAWDTRDAVIVTGLDVATFLALVARPLPDPKALGRP